MQHRKYATRSGQFEYLFSEPWSMIVDLNASTHGNTQVRNILPQMNQYQKKKKKRWQKYQVKYSATLAGSVSHNSRFMRATHNKRTCFFMCFSGIILGLIIGLVNSSHYFFLLCKNKKVICLFVCAIFLAISWIYERVCSIFATENIPNHEEK